MFDIQTTAVRHVFLFYLLRSSRFLHPLMTYRITLKPFEYEKKNKVILTAECFLYFALCHNIFTINIGNNCLFCIYFSVFQGYRIKNICNITFMCKSWHTLSVMPVLLLSVLDVAVELCCIIFKGVAK